jgi:colanic acid/amylovoran biosynthesis protein
VNFLITNSVPLNGGDEALLRALVESLTQRWPQSRATVLCKDVELARRYLPDLSLAPDLEFAEGASLRQISALYRDADVVLSAPGGFLHDFYPIEDRLRGFEVALALRKPLILLGQSIGPFWKAQSLRRIPQVLNRSSIICIRDEISREHLLAAGVHPAKIRQAADAAFLWRRLAPELFRPKQGEIRAIGLCFRAWPLGDTVAVKETIAKAGRLCRFLLNQAGRELVFISTCQGVPGYVDDSQVASNILEQLPAGLRDRCRVNDSRLAPRDLIRALSDCDAFIGMRLHGCLLAMLGGTPALGLGYEQKTQQIFRQLGFEECQLPFESDAESWLVCVQRFLANSENIRAQLPEALDLAGGRAEVNLEAIAECIAGISSPQRAKSDRSDRCDRAGASQSEWTNLVSDYDLPHLRLRQVAALIRQVAPKQMLDLGCATGQLRELCPGITYIGCDFVSPGKPLKFPFYECDFNHQQLPADLRELDAIVCSGLLEYIEDLPGFLAQIRSRLNPDGHFIATWFNMNHISRIWALLRGDSFPVRPDWHGFYAPRQFKRLIEQAGFSIERSFAMNHSFKPALPVGRTVGCPLVLPPERPWSALLAHQILLVARCRSVETAGPAGEIAQVIPQGCAFILVDDAQLATGSFGDRRPIPFLEKDGQYWGAPEDDATAIRELERLRTAGAAFIAFAPPAFWWLDHYSGFQKHLESNFKCIRKTESVVIYDLCL